MESFGYLSPSVERILVTNLFKRRGGVKKFVDENFRIRHEVLFQHVECCGSDLARITEDVLYDLAWELHEVFENLNFDFFAFLGREELYLRMLELYREQDENSDMVCALLSLAYFERSLVDVFKIQANGAKPPPLFRDMLEHEIMKDCLGGGLVNLVRAFSHPEGLNLRNCLWHGFLFRIPRPWIALIFGILEICSYRLRHLNHVRKSEGLLRFECEYLKDFNAVDTLHTFDKYSGSALVPESHEKFVNSALRRYNDGRKLEALCLICVALEMGLRQEFCKVNNLPQLALTADNKTLYTTLETFIREEDNDFIEYLGLGTVYAIQDIFFFSNGPRLRDRLSHGEISSSDCKHDVGWFFSFYFKLISKDMAGYKSICHPKSVALKALNLFEVALVRFEQKIEQRVFENVEKFEENDVNELFKRKKLLQYELENFDIKDVDFLFFATLSDSVLICKKVQKIFEELKQCLTLFEFKLIGNNFEKSYKLLSHYFAFADFSHICICMLKELMLVVEKMDRRESAGFESIEKVDKFLLLLISFCSNSKKYVQNNTFVHQVLEKLENIWKSRENSLKMKPN